MTARRVVPALAGGLLILGPACGSPPTAPAVSPVPPPTPAAEPVTVVGCAPADLRYATGGLALRRPISMLVPATGPASGGTTDVDFERWLAEAPAVTSPPPAPGAAPPPTDPLPPDPVSEAIAGSLRASAAALAACHADGRARQPGLHGSLTLLVAAPRGAPVDAAAWGLGEPATEACVVSAALALDLPADIAGDVRCRIDLGAPAPPRAAIDPAAVTVRIADDGITVDGTRVMTLDEVAAAEVWFRLDPLLDALLDERLAANARGPRPPGGRRAVLRAPAATPADLLAQVVYNVQTADFIGITYVVEEPGGRERVLGGAPAYVPLDHVNQTRPFTLEPPIVSVLVEPTRIALGTTRGGGATVDGPAALGAALGELRARVDLRGRADLELAAADGVSWSRTAAAIEAAVAAGFDEIVLIRASQLTAAPAR